MAAKPGASKPSPASKSGPPAKASAKSSGSPAAAKSPDNSPPDYGLDSPLAVKSMFSRAAWTFVFGFALWFMNRQEYPGPAASLLIALALLAALFAGAGWFMTWSSRTGKLHLRDRLIDELALTGDEKVLDAGCGLGLFAIGAAKRLKTGKVTAVDLWDPHALSGNSAEAARANARKEGAADRIKFEEGDLRKLASPPENFDVVLSAFALHWLADEPDRDQAVRELFRVLKPGGRLVIADTMHVGRYAQILKESGAGGVIVRGRGFLWCLPVKSVKANKS
ncbi:MAG TPA: class I SAM-dependent methyltransferase [Bryobacteraceae bacterium]|nr:class I SAM-dependent methyltransferase [Bryobacteraceae bacterium]